MISGSVIRNAAVDLRLSVFCRLERFRAGCVAPTRSGCNATSAISIFLARIISTDWMFKNAREPACRRLSTAERTIAACGSQPANRRGDTSRVLASHEAFALAFGPGEGLFHRLALVIAQAHLGQRGLCVDLLGDLGRRG